MNTLCDKFATNHSVCTGRATSCSNTSQRQIASYVLENFFLKMFASATEFCRFNIAKNIYICATCCGFKILLQRQRFSQKFSSTHEAIYRYKMSPRHVATTLARSVYRPLGFYRNISQFDDGF